MSPTPTVAALALALLLAPYGLSAQIIGTRGSAGLIAASPGGDFGDAQSNGIGAYAKLEASLVVIGIAAEVNAVRFGGEEISGGVSTDAQTIFGVQVGPRLNLLLAKVGVDLGYYSQFDGLGWGPAASLALGPLEVGASATFVDGGRWYALRGGIRF